MNNDFRVVEEIADLALADKVYGWYTGIQASIDSAGL